MNNAETATRSPPNQMRKAWMALGAYIFMYLFFVACFEWMAYKHGVVESIILLPLSFFYIIAFIASLIVFIKLALKRAFVPALIYAFIATTVPIGVATSSDRVAFYMQMKARIFAAYPSLCQTPIVQGQRISICYDYSITDTGGEEEQIYFNPGDELSLPPRQWPEDVKRMFNILVINSEDDLCGVRKTKHIIDHVYWMSYDCWKKQ